MKNTLCITCLFILGAFAVAFASVTQNPESKAALWLDNTFLPAAHQRVWDVVMSVPFIGLLDLSEYAPRPTLRPLQVVPATDTPYSPEELAEIYPSH